MIESLLIANRGEIASRIIRTARRMGVRTIAAYSAADANAPFVKQADAAIAIGAAPARESYLSADRILAAAKSSGASGIHPGYGFLSENAEFAEAVQNAGLIWVGAPPAAIRAMGLKDAAKALMMRAQVPVTPGYLGADQDPKALKSEASAIGYPILIKAVAGGGGKGMRRVEGVSGFDEALASCRREAAAAFGDDRVLIEKYIRSPRHIEVQVFGDTHGQIVHLYERDCSLQRRHQKVIEEAPAPGMDAETREFVCSIAVKAARAVNYVGAGTIEFIADASQGLRADKIWFMEMNTRLQVEHPVTEAITGQDLVEWQLRVAGGEPLPRAQQDLRIDGWAMEARLYAENPTAGFLPSTGPLRHLRLPLGLRVDSGIEEGGEVTGYYDPMIAKLIVHAPNRKAAARKLAAACAGVEVWPVRTNAAFLARVAGDAAFVAGDVDTGFIERRAATLIPASEPSVEVVRAAARALVQERGLEPGPWSNLTGFRQNTPAFTQVDVAVGTTPYFVALDPAQRPEPVSIASIDGQRVLFRRGEAWPFGLPDSVRVAGAVAVSDGALQSPMPGRIVSVAVRLGQIVTKGQTLLTLEAMKMEHALIAPFDGTVGELSVAIGDQVAENVTLVRIASPS
ncbi:MAG: 3-methylcrotonyl-CoA carboxylase alpha subunit [Gammaproteobacteria bacterium]|jgi:3-methylcrotonyl-CoA carboxylase alpha subunit|nr:3-methylcrotonyl-CoA carboxylase alpha subunit [Gammaproteobacteria bacterium]